jgi:nucleotide sugar dehydrogenase
MQKHVGIVGLGYVGLPLALLTSSKGYQVTGVDYDERKIGLINKGESPFVDDEVAAQLQTTTLKATTSYIPLRSAEIIIICVPTPVDDNRTPDLTLLANACEQAAENLQPGTLVIIESSINPGICEDVVLPALEKYSGMRCGEGFYLAHCPERINPGDPTWNVSNIARVVGGYDEKSLQLAADFYRSIIDGQITPMGSLKEAEAVKVVENSFRDINIAFVNELAMSFSKLGIDTVNVIDGAATKPFAFMAHYPGAGVGGHCIPVDPYYLIEYGKQNDFDHRFLSTARDINNNMPHFTVERLEELLGQTDKDLTNAKIALLGMSYKPNVGDLRESPSLVIAELLASRQADVVALDPYVRKTKTIDVHQASEPDEILQAIKGCDAVILTTAHNAYRHLDASFFEQAGIPVVVDGRNCLDKDAFTNSEVLYCGIGR